MDWKGIADQQSRSNATWKVKAGRLPRLDEEGGENGVETEEASELFKACLDAALPGSTPPRQRS